MKLKRTELKKMTTQELEKKLLELRKSLLKINAQIASGTIPENPGNVRNVKKAVAQILTLLHQQKQKEVQKDIHA